MTVADRLADRLEPGEVLLAAAGAIVTRRRRRGQNVPKGAFILAVTDRRLVAFATSTWRLRPGAILVSWRRDDGATIGPAALGRIRLVLPDRSVVTLSPFGGWSLSSLVDASA